jgi:phosphoglycerate dehydrogenase-like enzyme
MSHKIGIVGAGGIGAIHAAILAKIHVKLSAFFDLIRPGTSDGCTIWDRAAGSLAEL